MNEHPTPPSQPDHPNQPATEATSPPSGSGDAVSVSKLRVPIAVILGLTLFSGVVHGYLDGRWTKAEDLRAIGSQLEDLPERCGDWILVETSDIEEGAREMLRCYGSTVRIYEHRSYEAKITVALMFGPRGPIAVHTPEVCYDSIGTKQVKERESQVVTTPDARQELWSVQFSKRPDPKPVFDVWYGWSDGGEFQASEHPRFWLTENLYKIQLSGPVEQDGFKPCEDFLKSFLPHVERVIQ